jgi:hypothetical protein
MSPHTAILKMLGDGLLVGGAPPDDPQVELG